MSAQLATGPLHGPGVVDVRMMVVAHTSFRRELKLSAPAVRHVPEETSNASRRSPSTSTSGWAWSTTITRSRTSCSGTS